jgi:hypothetical protein
MLNEVGKVGDTGERRFVVFLYYLSESASLVSGIVSGSPVLRESISLTSIVVGKTHCVPILVSSITPPMNAWPWQPGYASCLSFLSAIGARCSPVGRMSCLRYD